jgi:hypothetical protein
VELEWDAELAKHKKFMGPKERDNDAAIEWGLDLDSAEDEEEQEWDLEAELARERKGTAPNDVEWQDEVMKSQQGIGNNVQRE